MKYNAIPKFIAVLVILTIVAPHAFAQDETGGARIEIPSLDINVNITTAYIRGDTWDFSPITSKAALLDLLPMPGDIGNTVIGAHSELAGRDPGPFYYLGEIQIGDEIIITFEGNTFRYAVSETWHVAPDDLTPLYPTTTEILTLLTCDDYNPTTGSYQQRFIVRAARIS